MECEIYVGLCCNEEKETRKSLAHQHAVAGCRQNSQLQKTIMKMKSTDTGSVGLKVGHKESLGNTRDNL